MDVLQEMIVKGDLSWSNLAVLAVFLGGIAGMMKFKAYLGRKGQKAQAVDEIKAMPCYAIDSVIDLPTATDSIQATINGIADDSFVVLSSPGRKHYIPVAQFASGALGNRISLQVE